jgi:hypothetical protein
MNETDCRAEIEYILTQAKTKSEWNDADRLRLRKFRSQLGTPAEVAELLGVSVATIYSWEKQTNSEKTLPSPPERKLRKFLEVIEKKASPIGDEDIEILGKVRKADYLFECGNYCDTFWTLRGGKPFLSLENDKMLDLVIKFLMSPDSPQSFLVFPAYQAKGGPNEAKETDSKISCDGLMIKLKEKLKGLRLTKHAHQMKPVEIADRQEAIDLGLADTWSAYAMAEYGTKGYARFGKSVDVWMEFVFDVSKDTLSGRSEEIRWLELPRDLAESWRNQRQAFWDKARKGFGSPGKSSGKSSGK